MPVALANANTNNKSTKLEKPSKREELSDEQPTGLVANAEALYRTGGDRTGETVRADDCCLRLAEKDWHRFLLPIR